MEDIAPGPVATPPRGKKVRELTDKERRDMYIALTAQSVNGVLHHGALSESAAKFGVSRSTISRLWKRYCLNRQNGLTFSPAIRSRKYSRHKPFKYVTSDILEHVPLIPLRQRTTVRDLAQALSISKSTIQRFLSMDDNAPLHAHSSAVKPTLTEENKLSRVMFAVDQVGENGLFKDLYDEVHIDGGEWRE
jgi:hypothetical protein